MPAYHQTANAAGSKVRSAVAHPFAEMKAPMGLFVRRIGVAWATLMISMVNNAANIKRRVLW